MEIAAVFVVLIGILIGLVIFAGLYIFTSFVYKGLFEKAGIRGVLGFVPFYRDWLLIEACGLNWYWFIAKYAPLFLGAICAMIPFVGSIASSCLTIVATIASVAISYNLNKKFQGSDSFLILLAILPIIGMAVLAFSKQYSFHAEVPVKPDGFFGDFGFIKKENTDGEVKAEVVKNEDVKVTKEEVKEAKEEATDAEVEDEKPKNKKKKTKKEEE